MIFTDKAGVWWKRSPPLFRIIGLCILFVTIANLMTEEDVDADWYFYCEMHQLWIETDGESGWPDYNEVYDECQVEGNE